VLDVDGSGEINFYEFVACVYSYGTYTWKGLCQYAFDLFDECKDGELDMAEVEKLVEYLYGGKVSRDGL
jgi:Ca2+-binding EF-hand superfamily protein